uniref:U11-Eretoxin-Ek1bg_1 n=1 Tax=Eresus cinnaberinus TaxID=175337 RepID=A0A2D0PEB5_ERECI
MVSHVTSIVSLFALLLGLAECAKCPYAKFTPQHSFCKDPNPKCTIWNEDYNQLTNNVL